MPKVGGKYRHYKGNIYEVLFLGKHTETEEDLVIYRAVEKPEQIWARPLPMWIETVEWEGKTVPRFAPLDD
jgi:hypothetical protein